MTAWAPRRFSDSTRRRWRWAVELAPDYQGGSGSAEEDSGASLVEAGSAEEDSEASLVEAEAERSEERSEGKG